MVVLDLCFVLRFSYACAPFPCNVLVLAFVTYRNVATKALLVFEIPRLGEQGVPRQQARLVHEHFSKE